MTPTRMCQSHRRRWIAGLPLDPRGYQRYEEGPDGVVRPVQALSLAPSPRRKPPFAKELTLLRELGLR